MKYTDFSAHAQQGCISIAQNANLTDEDGKNTRSFISVGISMSRDQARQLVQNCH